MIEPGHPRLSIVRQCALASISRASFYREPAGESEATLRLMRLIDEQFLETPWYGSMDGPTSPSCPPDHKIGCAIRTTGGGHDDHSDRRH